MAKETDDKIEEIIMRYKNNVKFLEDENENFIYEIDELRRSTLKNGNWSCKIVTLVKVK